MKPFVYIQPQNNVLESLNLDPPNVNCILPYMRLNKAL